MHACVLNRFSCVQFFACQAPLSIGFSRQEYSSGLPYSPPGDLPDPGIESISPVSPALAVRLFSTSATCEARGKTYLSINSQVLEAVWPDG